ncbi:hypothetical protein Gpo141_00006912 [Globisporangium polare]
MSAHSSPLTSAAVVLRGRPDVSALRHVVDAISALLDVSPQWTIAKAAFRGHVHLLERLVETNRRQEQCDHVDCETREAQFEKAMCKAARGGHLHVLEWLQRHCLPSPGGGADVRGAMTEAVRSGNGDLRVVRWLGRHYPRDLCDPHALEQAAGNGGIHVLQWFAEHRPLEWRAVVGFTNPLHAAVASGQLETVIWLHTVAKRPLFFSALLATAAENGRVHVMEWLYSQSSSNTRNDRLPTAIDSAARNGHQDALQWLHLHGYDREGCATTQAMDLAAANGHLHVVEWLHRIRSEGCTTNAMDSAASNGHAGVVQWLHANRDEGCTLRSVVGAATRGDLSMLRWLQHNRHHDELLIVDSPRRVRIQERRPRPAVTDAMDNAAAGGFLDVVQWLHANRPLDGCTTKAMDQAAAHEHLHVLQWLHEHRSEGCTTAAMDNAAANGHLNVIQWLHENRVEGCTTAAMDAAAREGHLEVVRWLHRHRLEGCTTAAMDESAIRGHLHVFQFLHEHRREGCTVRAATHAAMKGRLDVLAFLFANYRDAIDLVEVRGVSRSCSRVHILKWLRDVAMLESSPLRPPPSGVHV